MERNAIETGLRGAMKKASFQEAGRQLRALRMQGPLGSLRSFAKEAGMNVSYFSKAEHGAIPINRRLIDHYVSFSGHTGEDADMARDRILLLTGKAPANLTPEEATTLALAVFAYKKGRRSLPKEAPPDLP